MQVYQGCVQVYQECLEVYQGCVEVYQGYVQVYQGCVKVYRGVYKCTSDVLYFYCYRSNHQMGLPLYTFRHPYPAPLSPTPTLLPCPPPSPRTSPRTYFTHSPPCQLELSLWTAVVPWCWCWSSLCPCVSSPSSCSWWSAC